MTTQQRHQMIASIVALVNGLLIFSAVGSRDMLQQMKDPRTMGEEYSWLLGLIVFATVGNYFIIKDHLLEEHDHAHDHGHSHNHEHAAAGVSRHASLLRHSGLDPNLAVSLLSSPTALSQQPPLCTKIAKISFMGAYVLVLYGLGTQSWAFGQLLEVPTPWIYLPTILLTGAAGYGFAKVNVSHAWANLMQEHEQYTARVTWRGMNGRSLEWHAPEVRIILFGLMMGAHITGDALVGDQITDLGLWLAVTFLMAAFEGAAHLDHVASWKGTLQESGKLTCLRGLGAWILALSVGVAHAAPAAIGMLHFWTECSRWVNIFMIVSGALEVVMGAMEGLNHSLPFMRDFQFFKAETPRPTEQGYVCDVSSVLSSHRSSLEVTL
ncbi:MAG: hypothetical protein A3J38_07480 [Gammaproteobacteria bacterium RIFCSPHIGHO2_12_FULL_45_9]|nr:MAG: hypothetical protein A3J38_07480 [Gammaproteobacteria bacterium RIFCSPHIGHO2_12_FULL_45_9]